MDDTLYRCTVCGRTGTVGRCCGEETREPLNDLARQEQEKIKSQNLPKADACPQLGEVTELIIDAVNIDGAHHKQWYLEQIAVKLGIELPEHEKGIIP